MKRKLLAIVLSCCMIMTSGMSVLADSTAAADEYEISAEVSAADASEEAAPEEPAIESAQEAAIEEPAIESAQEAAPEETDIESDQEAVQEEAAQTALDDTPACTVGPVTDEMIAGFAYYEEVDEHSVSASEAFSISLYELNNTSVWTLYDLLDDIQQSIYNSLVSAAYGTGLSASNNSVTINVLLDEDDDAEDIAALYKAEYANALFAFVYDNIQFVPWFNGKISFGCSYDSSRISFTYIIGASAYYTDAVGAAIDAKLQEICNTIPESADFYDRYKVLHDYLVLNSEYESAAVNNNDHDSEQFYFAHSQAGVLTRGTGVCESYAKAFQALCNMQSLGCMTVISETHAWNYVKLDGIWYMVDCTFDDPVGAAADYCGYDYFFVSNNPYVDDDHVPIRFNYPATSTEDYVPAQAGDPDDGRLVFKEDLSEVGSSGEITVRIPASSDDYSIFYFTPAVSGKYVIESLGNYDPWGFLWLDGEQELIDYNDDNPNGGANFMMEHELTAGNTYKIQAADRGGSAVDYDLVIRITHANADSCSHVSQTRHYVYNDTEYTGAQWYGSDDYSFTTDGAGYAVPCGSTIEIKEVCEKCGQCVDSYIYVKNHIFTDVEYRVGDETYDSFEDVYDKFEEDPIIYKEDSTCAICQKDNCDVSYFDDGDDDNYTIYSQWNSDGILYIYVYNNADDVPKLAKKYTENDDMMSRYTGVILPTSGSQEYVYFEDGVQDMELSGIITVDGTTYAFKNGSGAKVGELTYSYDFYGIDETMLLGRAVSISKAINGHIGDAALDVWSDVAFTITNVVAENVSASDSPICTIGETDSRVSIRCESAGRAKITFYVRGENGKEDTITQYVDVVNTAVEAEAIPVNGSYEMVADDTKVFDIHAYFVWNYGEDYGKNEFEDIQVSYSDNNASEIQDIFDQISISGNKLTLHSAKGASYSGNILFNVTADDGDGEYDMPLLVYVNIVDSYYYMEIRDENIINLNVGTAGEAGLTLYQKTAGESGIEIKDVINDTNTRVRFRLEFDETIVQVSDPYEEISIESGETLPVGSNTLFISRFDAKGTQIVISAEISRDGENDFQGVCLTAINLKPRNYKVSFDNLAEAGSKTEIFAGEEHIVSISGSEIFEEYAEDEYASKQLYTDWTVYAVNDGESTAISEGYSLTEGGKAIALDGAALAAAATPHNEGFRAEVSIQIYDMVLVQDSFEFDVKQVQAVSVKSVVSDAAGMKVTWGQNPEAAGYVLYRSTDKKTWTKVTAIYGNETVSYVDKAASENGQKYYYRVRAFVKENGVTHYSEYSPAVVGFYLAKPVISSVSNVSDGLKITWKQNDQATGYLVYRSTDNKTWKKIKSISGNTTISYTDTAPSTTGKKYYYKVVSYVKPSSTAYYSAESAVKAMYLVQMPSISALENPSAGKLVVRWDKVTGTGYEIQYSTSSKFTSSTTKTVTVTSYKTLAKSVTGLTKGKTYYVRIRTYKTISGKNYYSTWSKTSSMKMSK